MGNLKLGKHLEWRDWDETMWEKISTSPRYMIEITGTGPLSFGVVRGGGGG